MFGVDYLLDDDVTPPWSPTEVSSLCTADVEVWLGKPVRDNHPSHAVLCARAYLLFLELGITLTTGT